MNDFKIFNHSDCILIYGKINLMSIEDLPYLREIQLKKEKIDNFDHYPFNIPIIKNLKSLTFHPNVTFIVGENGSGKSTLIEAIAVALGFNPEGGTKNFCFSTYQSHSFLNKYIKLINNYKKPKDGFFLRAESFYNLASNVDELDKGPGGPPIKNSYGGKSLHFQSHGESFFSLMLYRFGGKGLYILDEPEAALSPSRQLAMLSRMHELVKDKSQFIVATHSPILMAYPNSTIISLDNDQMIEIAYEETEHYQTTKSFINNYKNMLNHLL